MISKKSETRIVLDTNIWISFTIGKRLKLLSDLLLSKKLMVYFSNEIIEDIIELIHNDCIKQRLKDTYYVLAAIQTQILKHRLVELP